MAVAGPAALREEAGRWIGLAGQMSTIHRRTESQLRLSPTAFFIGNLTDVVHHPVYRDLWQRMVTLLGGASIEFALIGLVLERIADSYEPTGQLDADQTGELYTVTAGDVAGVMEDSGDGPRSPEGARPAVTQPALDELRSVFEGLFHGPLPEVVGEGEGLFPLIEAGDALAGKVQDVVDTFHSTMSMRGLIPNLFIAHHLGNVLDAMPALIEKLDYAVDRYAPVVSLFEASAGWTGEVMTPLSRMAGVLERDVDNTSLREWDDDARAVYSRDIVPHQRSAVGQVKGKAASIGDRLSTIGVANTGYATALVLAVADVFGQLVTIVAELASVVGSPFSIQDAAELVSTTIRGAAGVVTDAVNVFAKAVADLRSAENELSDHPCFPGGEWPEAVTRA